jgi:hypothetical protein
MGEIMHMIRVSHVVLEVRSEKLWNPGRIIRGLVPGRHGKPAGTLINVSSNAGAYFGLSVIYPCWNQEIQAKKWRPPGRVRGLGAPARRKDPNSMGITIKVFGHTFCSKWSRITKVLVCG